MAERARMINWKAAGLPFNQPDRCIELLRAALGAGTAELAPQRYVMLRG